MAHITGISVWANDHLLLINSVNACSFPCAFFLCIWNIHSLLATCIPNSFLPGLFLKWRELTETPSSQALCLLTGIWKFKLGSVEGMELHSPSPYTRPLLMHLSSASLFHPPRSPSNNSWPLATSSRKYFQTHNILHPDWHKKESLGLPFSQAESVGDSLIQNTLLGDSLGDTPGGPQSPLIGLTF